MPESFLLWDPAQVSHYLLPEIGEDVSSLFIENNVDGSLLPFLTTDHLRELGIQLLGSRLRVKKLINDLIVAHFHSSSDTPEDPLFRLNAVNVNSNYVSMEALSLSLELLKDLSATTIKIADDSVSMRQLNDNFRKLKTELIPLVRWVKETKPLPMPTLDPGLPASLPTQSVNSINSTSSWLASESDNTPTVATTLSLPNNSPLKLRYSPSQINVPPPSSGSAPSPSEPQGSIAKSNSAQSLQRFKPSSSPTQSKRFSSGSVLSVGVGKVTDVKAGNSTRLIPKPRLVDAKLAPSRADDVPDYAQKGLSRQPSSKAKPTLNSKPSASLVVSAGTMTPSPTNQPLKQLKASTDDTCLKVLQHAMKRHHIPREKWSKYVLVVCYGDKERILKLTERPVVIFKELQELGKNPAIMLRERAPTNDSENNYEDSRIGDDIPGGTL